MNPLYPVLLLLSIMIFLDYKFFRVLAYAIAFNFIVAIISLQTEMVSGTVLFLFGCIFFPLLMWFAIEKCEKVEKEWFKEMVAITIISVPALYLFFAYLGITEDHAMLFLIFAFSMIAILTAKNLLKFLFIFDVAENTLILTAYSFFSANITQNLPAVIFIEMATFLPLVLLTYLTIHMFKKYRSLNPWRLWH
jgi:hypothetical protein